MLADFVGSTQALLNYATNSQDTEFLVATESGIIHQMQKQNPNKVFIPIPPVDSTCGCNDCKYMRLNSLEKLYLCLKTEQPEILVDEALRVKAVKPIERMLELSK